jgi:ribosomal protein S27E
MKVKCETENCENKGIVFEFDNDYPTICGVCGADITNKGN